MTSNINYGALSEVINDKMDLDMDNAAPSKSAQDTLFGWLGADTTAGVALVSGTVLPQNGWIVCSYTDTSYGVAMFKLDDIVFYQQSYQSQPNTRVGTIFGVKGQVFTLTTSGTCTATATFYPLIGEQNA